ncbi:MAG: hypothetical protein LBM96_08910, partial [Methanobrevibacter sp.]|nr:hypothetical protein [Candidatus Methanoflexus mossambicus]
MDRKQIAIDFAKSLNHSEIERIVSFGSVARGYCKVLGSFVKINMWDLMEDKCKKVMFLNSFNSVKSNKSQIIFILFLAYKIFHFNNR